MQPRQTVACILSALSFLLAADRPLGAEGPPSPATPQPEEQKLEAQSRTSSRKGSFAERWRVGLTTSFYSGLERIRSDSANLVLVRDIQINEGAIRFEPRVTTDPQGDGTADPVQISMSPATRDLQFTIVNDFILDPRKDSGSTRDTALEETLWASIAAAYDVKTWKYGTLFLQLDGGYYKGEVGNIEVAVDIAEQAILNPADQDQTADDPFANYQFIYPAAGTLTQIPVSLAGMWQFRPRSPFRPYIGLGIGYLNATLEDSPSLDLVNGQLANIDYEWEGQHGIISEGVLPPETITAEVKSSYFYLAQGGLEYNINRHWSVYLDSRFQGTPASVTIRALGFTQFGSGIGRSTLVEDRAGITSAEVLINRLLSLSVEDAVALLADINDRASNPADNESQFFRSFPVELGSPIPILVPNPIMPTQNTTISRQTKLFVKGGDVGLDSFSLGFGFRYRF